MHMSMYVNALKYTGPNLTNKQTVGFVCCLRLREETMAADGSTVSNLTDWAGFMRYEIQQLDEMMDQSLNHPAIMTWAWFK